MQVTFTCQGNWVLEHEQFVRELMMELSMNPNFVFDICYLNEPYGINTIRFSEYAQSYGCTLVNNHFYGYFGERSYSALLFQFLAETLGENEGLPYKLEIDIPYEQVDTSAQDLLICSDYVNELNSREASI